MVVGGGGKVIVDAINADVGIQEETPFVDVKCLV